MPFVKNGQIHYRTVGQSGPWVVLIQGLGLSGDFWMKQPERLAAAGYRVVVPDNRGFGLSAKVTRPYRLPSVADDIKAVLDDVGADKAIIAGISLGGMIAQQVAFAHPERVQALLLLCTTPGIPAARIPPLKSLLLLLASPALLRTQRGADLLMRTMLARKNWARARELFADWEHVVRTQRADPASFAWQFVAGALHFSTKKLARIQCPTLVVAADEDAIFPLPTAQALHKAIPGAQLRVIPNTGHTLLMEAADALIEGINSLHKPARAAQAG